jgi:hypothetical protein
MEAERKRRRILPTASAALIRSPDLRATQSGEDAQFKSSGSSYNQLRFFFSDPACGPCASRW